MAGYIDITGYRDVINGTVVMPRRPNIRVATGGATDDPTNEATLLNFSAASSSATATRLIVDPGATPSGNVYATLTAACAVAAASPSLPFDIIVMGNIGTASGALHMANVRLINGLPYPALLTFSGTATWITVPQEIRGVNIEYTGTASLCAIDGAELQTSVRSASLETSAAGSFFSALNSAYVSVAAVDSSITSSGAGHFFDVSGSAEVAIEARNATFLGDSSGFVFGLSTSAKASLEGTEITLDSSNVCTGSAECTFNLIQYSGRLYSAEFAGDPSVYSLSIGADVVYLKGVSTSPLITPNRVAGMISVTVTADYVARHNQHVSVDTSGGPVQVTLPSSWTPTAASAGIRITDAKGTFGTNACTVVTRLGVGQVDGSAAAVVLSTNWGGLDVVPADQKQASDRWVATRFGSTSEPMRVAWGASSTTTASIGRADIYAATTVPAPRTLTISSAHIASVTPSAPWIFTVKDESGNAGTNNITVATEGAETIDGAATSVISTDYGHVTLYSNGTSLGKIG